MGKYMYYDSFALGGYYILTKEDRGEGYGKKICDAAMASMKHFPSPAAGGDQQFLWISYSVLRGILHL